MEQLPENSPEQLEEPITADIVKPSVGTVLREGRERMGLSIEDVVGKIKLAPRQILALESDDFQSLPETAFLRGFVRSYAKLLQLDAQPLLDALPDAAITQAPVEQCQIEAPFPTEKTARRQNLNLLIAALFVTVLIAGFTVWQARAPHEPVAETATVSAASTASEVAAADVSTAALALPEQPEILDASGVVDASESAVSAPAVQMPVVQSKTAQAASAVISVAPAQAQIRLVFDKESWAEIKDKTGKTLSRQVNQSGSQLRVEGAAPFTLVIGHAAAVHLFYRDKPVDLSAYINASSDVARMTLE